MGKNKKKASKIASQVFANVRVELSVPAPPALVVVEEDDDDTDRPCGEELYGYDANDEDTCGKPFAIYAATYADKVLNPSFVPEDVRGNAWRINRATVLGLAVEAYLSRKQNGGTKPAVLSEDIDSDVEAPLYRALYEYVSFAQTYVGDYDTISEVKSEANFWLMQILAQVGSKLFNQEIGPLPAPDAGTLDYCLDREYRVL